MTEFHNGSTYALRGTDQTVDVELIEYDEHSGLTMVYFECPDGSKGAMDKRTFLQFYTTEVQR